LKVAIVDLYIAEFNRVDYSKASNQENFRNNMKVIHPRQSVWLNIEDKQTKGRADSCHEDQSSEEMLIKHCDPKHK